jgi:hypothetical protein
LDWLYAHDPMTLCAGLALRARRAFGSRAQQVHVETTCFSGVRGEYEADLDAHTLAVPCGYSRDRPSITRYVRCRSRPAKTCTPLPSDRAESGTECQRLVNVASDNIEGWLQWQGSEQAAPRDQEQQHHQQAAGCPPRARGGDFLAASTHL